MTKKLIIIGAGGHGKVLADIASLMGHWKEVLFVDDSPQEAELIGYPIIGTTQIVLEYKGIADFFIAIGNNEDREKIFRQVEGEKLSIATLIHPNAIIGRNVSIGRGTAIMGGAVINPSTVIEEGVIINTGSTIDHDSVVGRFTHISPGVNVAGAVKIGERCWIGIGSTIVNNLEICNNVTIGAASLVLRDILVSGVYVGNKLRRINK